MKRQSFLKGTAILVAANFMVKIIGAVFKIPLAHILNEEGMALFSSAYNLYAILFVIATAGLPVAVSKMVSESTAKNNDAEARKIFHAALSLLTIIGLLGACVLFFCANILAESIGSENSALGIMSIAPAIFFVAVLSAFRGYFQGRSNMTPTALSEVAEALGKLVIGLALASVLLPTGLINASAGAVLGVTTGSFLGCFTIVLIYFVDKRRIQAARLPVTQPVRSMRRILLQLVGIAVPITLGAAVSSLTNLIDLFTIRQRLGTILVSPELYATMLGYFGLSGSEISIGAPLSGKAAEILYGSYSGYAIPMFNLPLTIITALSMCLVPAISGAFALKNIHQVRRLTEVSIRITTLFALPCAAGLSLLSVPILAVIYNNARAASMLSVLGWAVIFVCLVSVTTAILQASGHVMLPVAHMAAGAVVKIAVNFVLLSAESLNIGGAPFSTILCYLTIAGFNLFSIHRIIKPQFRLSDNLLKPIFSVILMGFGAYGTYQTASRWLGAPLLKTSITFLPQDAPITPLESDMLLKTGAALFLAIIVGAAIYFAALFAVKALRKEDIQMITKRG